MTENNETAIRIVKAIRDAQNNYHNSNDHTKKNNYVPVIILIIILIIVVTIVLILRMYNKKIIKEIKNEQSINRKNDG
jgi:cation transport ATPase